MMKIELNIYLENNKLLYVVEVMSTEFKTLFFMANSYLKSPDISSVLVSMDKTVNFAYIFLDVMAIKKDFTGYLL